MINMTTKEYQDFCQSLAKSGDVMDKEISINEERLLDSLIDLIITSSEISGTCFSTSVANRPLALQFKHMAIALSGEVGEIIDWAKGLIIYRKTLDKEKMDNIFEEVGDILFYWTEIGRLINLPNLNIANSYKNYHHDFLINLKTFIKWVGVCYDIHISVELAMINNYEKLSKRYAKKEYSNEQAIKRADKN